MAHKKGASSSRNGRDSNAQRLGVKRFGGQLVKAGDRLIVLEAMKMELAITAPSAGELIEMRCAPGAMVQPGQVLAVLR